MHISTLKFCRAAQIFDETLVTLFNAAGGGLLYVENLKGARGEIALRIGDNGPFGVINVGDDAKLVKLCEENGLQTERPGVLGLSFSRNQFAAFHRKPANRFEKVYRGLEQLARKYNGADERGSD